MRIAVIRLRTGGVFIFQVKGRNKDLSAIDGFDEYFSATDDSVGWHPNEIESMELAHVGTGHAVIITPKTDIDVHHGHNIDDWLPDEEE